MQVSRNNKLNKYYTKPHANSPTFNGNFLPQVYKGLKNGSVAKTDLSAFTLDMISGGCYLVGGTGLLYDFASERKNKKDHSIIDNHEFKPILKTKNIEQFLNPEISASFQKAETKKSEGAQTIVPKTNFAKLGLKFARVAVLTAGVAGIFTGLSANLPLWALGEGITAFSAPIIETPVGTGIFGVGLAMINLARVLDSNPEFQINRDKFRTATNAERAKMVSKNISATFKELGKSTKAIFGNLFKLFSPKAKEGLSFFKNKMFSFKPTGIAIQELITKEGKVALKTRPINNPYLMHFAAFGLTVSSIALMLTNTIKAHKAEKASLRGYGISNGVDNIALAKWGVEKMSIEPKASGKVTGGAFTIAGISLLTGQAGIDQNWGRGLMWNGIGAILLGMGFEAGLRVVNAVKNKSVSPSLVREWKIIASDTIFNKKLIGDITTKINEAIPENTIFNENSQQLMQKLKTSLSEVKELKSFELSKISDTKDINKVKTDLIERENRFNS